MTTEIKLSENGYAVTYDPETGWNLYIPQLQEETDEMDVVGGALVAAFMRLNNDEDFLAEQLAWLEEEVKKEEEKDDNLSK
jgi:hypothetical protein